MNQHILKTEPLIWAQGVGQLHNICIIIVEPLSNEQEL